VVAFVIAAANVRRSKTYGVLVVTLVTLSGCAPLAEIREITPRLGAQPGKVPQLRRAEQAIADAEQLQRSDPNRAIGFYLSGVESATRELRSPRFA